MDASGYEIAVRREDAGRGGSRLMHHCVRPGDRLRVTMPTNLFALDLTARRDVLIGGGIGITPVLAQLRQLQRLQMPFELHYAVRSRDEAAGLHLLPALPQIHVHISSEGDRIDPGAILSGQPLGTHVYTCGPVGLIEAVANAGACVGCSKAALHSEAFLAQPPGKPFQVTLVGSGHTSAVGAHQSLLEALEANGIAVDWTCRGGACGRCETRVAACHGRIDHKDYWLSDDQKAAQVTIMPCVSRFQASALVLDLQEAQ